MTTLLPAYGRDYANAKAVKDDWNAQKDFIICDMFSGNDGRYINKQQGKPGESFIIRYKQQRNFTIVKA